MQIQQQKFWPLIFMSILMLTGFSPEPASSQSSEHTRTEQVGLNAGSGTWTTSKYRIKGSLGQLPRMRISVSEKALRSSEPSGGDVTLLDQSLKESISTPEISELESISVPSSFSVIQTPTPVPESGTFLLFGAGMIGMFLLIKRTRRKRE
jgi:hypothetical protein